MKMVRKTVWLAVVLVCVPGWLHAQARGPELPAGDGRDLAQSVCATACHDATPLLMKRDGESGWRRNVERMVVQKGAQLFPADLETLVRYLSTRLGPGTGLMETALLPPGALGGGAATAKEVHLPEGPGKDLVEARCTVCHDLGRVVTVRRTARDWEQITRNMMERGPRGSAAQIETVAAYLSTHFRKEAE
jgi:cytochrome c5